MLPPHGTSVERLKRVLTRLHAGEAAHPVEAVRIVAIPQLAENRHPDSLLRLYEFAVEQVDQGVSLAGVQRITTEFDHLASIAATHCRGRCRRSSFFKCCRSSAPESAQTRGARGYSSTVREGDSAAGAT